MRSPLPLAPPCAGGEGAAQGRWAAALAAAERTSGEQALAEMSGGADGGQRREEFFGNWTTRRTSVMGMPDASRAMLAQ